MSGQSVVWVLLTFALYLIGMLAIGTKYAKGTNNSEDYLLGGRGLNGWVAALSAQASDMSGWLLMGLPGAIYTAGIGEIWIAVGLFIGTVCNWVFVATRLRRYTIKAGNSLTLPAFFENRFQDRSRLLLLISSIFIVIFFLIYTASALASGGKLFHIVFGLDYRLSLTIGTLVILLYTFLGGFMAVCVTDFIQGMLMLIGLLAVPIIAFFLVGGENIAGLIEASGAVGGAKTYFHIFKDGSGQISPVRIISNLSWGLGYFGMPHIISRFMAVRSEKELNKSKIIGIVWVALSLGFACFIGILGRAYLMPKILDGAQGSPENVFIEMIIKMFTVDYRLPLVGGIFLCGILAAIMSTADSQLLVTASSASEDIYKKFLYPKADDKKVLRFSRIIVVVVAILAYIIALNPKNSIMGLVSNAWAGFGAAFGPLVLFSLFWRRCNQRGAVLGMILGGITVLVWDYLPIAGGRTLGETTALYSLVVGFAISSAAIVLGSLMSGEPNAKILDEFDAVARGDEDVK